MDQVGHKTPAGRVKPPRCQSLQEDTVLLLISWLQGTALGWIEGMGQCRGAFSVTIPTPALHPHLQDLIQAKFLDLDTLTIAPTKCFACASNNLAGNGAGKSF